MAMSTAALNTRQRLSAMNPDGVKYFMEKLVFQIYEHFDEQDLTDVTFKLSNPTNLVTAHRLILSAASPYFKQLFKSDEGACPLIEITNIDSDTFERLITFCYTGNALITMENVDEMIKAASILQLDDAVADCVDFLLEHITDYTLQRAYNLENETQCDVLMKKVFEYNIRNFTSIFQSAEFLQFDAKKLQAILESDDLNVRSEKDAFEAVKRWYEHDAPARKQHLPDLISCLRLTQFESDFLLAHVQPLPGCHLLALEALSWIAYPSSRSSLSLRYTKGRKDQIVAVEESLMALNINFGTIFKYNKTEDLWEKWTDMAIPAYPRFLSVIHMNGNLIFTGGIRNGNTTNEVISWNLKTKTFKKLAPMREARHLHCVAIVNGKIYAIGGDNGQGKRLNSMEMYTDSNGWETMKNLMSARSRAAVVVLNDLIYVIGGEKANKCTLKSVERYDPTTNCWTQCADMNERRKWFGATVHNGQIYVVGGFNRTSRGMIKSIERYDPKRNEWFKVGQNSNSCCYEMRLFGCSFHAMCCISIDNQLWAFGGDSPDNVSVYDEQNDKWIQKTPLPMEGHYYCFTTANDLLQITKENWIENN